MASLLHLVTTMAEVMQTIPNLFQHDGAQPLLLAFLHLEALTPLKVHLTLSTALPLMEHGHWVGDDVSGDIGNINNWSIIHESEYPPVFGLQQPGLSATNIPESRSLPNVNNNLYI